MEGTTCSEVLSQGIDLGLVVVDLDLVITEFG